MMFKEELLIFMEYCPEGTLESVCREGLLDMRCVRRYTHYLLKGVEYIHNKMIIHRDIKRKLAHCYWGLVCCRIIWLK